MNFRGKLLSLQVGFILMSVIPMFSAWETFVPKSRCGNMKPGHGRDYGSNHAYTISVKDASTNQLTSTYGPGKIIKGMCAYLLGLVKHSMFTGFIF